MTTGKHNEVARVLSSLIEIDLRALAAYTVAVDEIDDEGDRAQLGEFKNDHERHIHELEPLVAELGGETKQKPDVKALLKKMRVALAGLVGDRAILRAMMTYKQADIAYRIAASRDDLPTHVREVLRRNQDDEHRHIDYIAKRLEEIEHGEDVPEKLRLGKPVPPGEPTPGLP